jgi:hypothetical protein
MGDLLRSGEDVHVARARGQRLLEQIAARVLVHSSHAPAGAELLLAGRPVPNDRLGEHAAGKRDVGEDVELVKLGDDGLDRGMTRHEEHLRRRSLVGHADGADAPVRPRLRDNPCDKIPAVADFVRRLWRAPHTERRAAAADVGADERIAVRGIEASRVGRVPPFTATPVRRCVHDRGQSGTGGEARRQHHVDRETHAIAHRHVHGLQRDVSRIQPALVPAERRRGGLQPDDDRDQGGPAKYHV